MSDWRYPGFQPEPDRLNPCDGCHECALRCSGAIQMTENEFERILTHLRGLNPQQVLRVLEQEKTVHWFEETWREACLFQDVSRDGCLIYPVRPLVCRLFGRVEWLPCPLERPLPMIARGIEIIQAYARDPRASFGEWCSTRGVFDLRRLFAGR